MAASSLSVRPFAAAPQRSASALRPRCTRVVVAAAKKGFGDKPSQPPKEQRPAQQSDFAASDAAPSPSPQQPPAQRAQMETPQVVVDRMLRRILTFALVPAFGGMAMLPAFYWLKVVLDVDYPLWIVYVAQTATFGGALLGITYGALSASWDPNREGSALGWTEMQANLAILLNKNK